MIIDNKRFQEKIANSGFVIFDDFFPNNDFERLNEMVVDEWQNNLSWHTRVKNIESTLTLPRLSRKKTLLLRKVMDRQRKLNTKKFTYLYHSLFKDDDKSSTVTDIENTLFKYYSSLLQQSVKESHDSCFSLTCFTPECYLDMHTDCSNKKSPYKLAIIIYFGDRNGEHGRDLTFNYHGLTSNIEPIPNRCVMFYPTEETNHAILPVESDDETVSNRFAFSGWLL